MTNKACSTVGVCAHVLAGFTHFCLVQQPVPREHSSLPCGMQAPSVRNLTRNPASHPRTRCGPGFSGSSCVGLHLNSLVFLRKQASSYIGYIHCSSQLGKIFAKLIFFLFLMCSTNHYVLFGNYVSSEAKVKVGSGVICLT